MDNNIKVTQFTLANHANELQKALALSENHILAIIAVHQLTIPDVNCIKAETEAQMYEIGSNLLTVINPHHVIGDKKDLITIGQFLQRSYYGNILIMYVLAKEVELEFINRHSLTFVVKQKEKVKKEEFEPQPSDSTFAV